MLVQENKSYFGFVTESFVGFLNEIVKEPTHFSLFRKPNPTLEIRKEVIGAPLRAELGLPDIKEEPSSTFTSQSDGRVLVFRNPIPFKLSINVYAELASTAECFRIFDKWFSYFFDNRSIEAFVPTFFQKYGDLNQKLVNTKAEVRLQKSPFEGTTAPLVCFTYSHLYHSGNPLREEFKTKQRVLDIREVPNASVD